MRYNGEKWHWNFKRILNALEKALPEILDIIYEKYSDKTRAIYRKKPKKIEKTNWAKLFVCSFEFSLKSQISLEPMELDSNGIF